MSTTQATTETPRGLRRILKILADDGFDVVHADDGTAHSSGCKSYDHTLIVLVTAPALLAQACMRVVILLGRHGIRFDGDGTNAPWVHGSYDPIEDHAEIELHQLRDLLLPPEPN